MNARRLILAVALATLVVLGPARAALAAAPEAPETLKAESVAKTHALLDGVLDPGKTGGPGTFEVDTYEFLYKVSATECKGGTPTTEGLSLGEGHELVAQEVTGLQPETEYSVCLVAKNGGEETMGSRTTFITGPPEPPETGAATEVAGTTAKLSGVLYPHHSGERVDYRLQYWQSTTECEHEEELYGSIYHLFEAAGEGEGTGKQGEAVTATATGLLPHTTYTFCLTVREPGEGEREATKGLPVTFTTQTIAPAVSGGETPSVGSVEATVAAEVDAGGLSTSYRVEYGTTDAYGTSSETASAGSGSVPVSARVRLSGLQPATEYHYRFVSQNERGTATGPDQTLVTTAAAGATASVLPDNRAYELVSSPQEDVTVDSLTGSDHGVPRNESDEASYQPDRAAADGDAIAYPGNPSLESGSGAFADSQSNEWVATRTSTGWADSDITPSGADSYAEYSYFSNDLSLSVLFADNGVEIPASPLAPVTCRENIYTRTADGSYHSLIAKAPAAGGCGGPEAAYPSADGSHVLFQATAALTAGASPGRLNLYDAVGGTLYQVNILPDGQPESSPYAWLGGAPAKDEGYTSPNFSNAVSSDGARVFWTSTEAVAGEVTVSKGLYMRENDAQPQSPIGSGGECTDAADACTVQIDRAEPKCLGEGKCSSGGGVFQTATADGSKVFFTDDHRLTADSTAEPEEPDLYEDDVESGTLTDLTVDAGGHANVQGIVGAGEDGEYVYFAAKGVLATNAASDGETAQQANEEGETSIYVRHGGVTTFIASGNVYYGALWNEAFTDWAHSLGNRTAEVTPDGQDMVFESYKELTGYDNREAGTGAPEAEVFVYDASTGRLSCSSCNPTGAPLSEGASHLSKLPVPGSGPRRVEAYQERLISANGSRVFFETGQPLIPQDTNGLEDVYEWERPADASEANNSCAISSPSYSSENEGCVYLISGGQDADGSYIADADADGDNLFFTSREDLAPSAGDNEAVALYDARVGGGFPELKTACTGTGCQGVPPAPPIFATPASVTYAGVGNFEPQAATTKRSSKPKQAKCKRGEVRKAGRCVKQKKKKRSKQAKRSSKRSKRRKK